MLAHISSEADIFLKHGFGFIFFAEPNSFSDYIVSHSCLAFYAHHRFIKHRADCTLSHSIHMDEIGEFVVFSQKTYFIESESYRRQENMKTSL